MREAGARPKGKEWARVVQAIAAAKQGQVVLFSCRADYQIELMIETARGHGAVVGDSTTVYFPGAGRIQAVKSSAMQGKSFEGLRYDEAPEFP